MNEPKIVVQHREQLAELLTEAVEIEHNLMCCYLYAAWSLKRAPSEGLTAAEAEAVGRWRRVILDVAIDEMTHFANANNMLCAIGGRGHIGRPNFPVSPGYHPAEVVVALHPFDASTIDHFVFLERPEGVALADGDAYPPGPQYTRETHAAALMPSAQDFATVGHLYRGIREGFEQLAASLGEARLFASDPARQISPDDVTLDGLTVVSDLASALAAIDAIVTQGEGNVSDPETSHYRKFCVIRDELAALTAANPAFTPARPVAKNPVQRRPPIPDGKTWVGAPDAAAVLDLANALYNHMLQLLGAGYDALPPETHRGLVTQGISLMRLLDPVNDVLTQLSVADHGPPHAGMSFAVTREVRVPAPSRAVEVLTERTRELAVGAQRLAADHAGLAEVSPRLHAIAERIAALPAPTELSSASIPRGSPASVSSTPAPVKEQSFDPTIPPRTIVDGVEHIDGRNLELRFDTKRCIHARFCVIGAQEVFIGNVEGPWIRPDAMDVEDLVAIAHQCPSGAITYTRKDGRPDEKPPSVNTIRLREDGPLALHADLQIEGDRPRTRATLCRCGASKRKPFCDGSHADAGFRSTGEPPTGDKPTLTARDGLLRVQPFEDGPLGITGNLEILSGTGRTIAKLQKTALCRCGQSSNKPYCDGTHRKVGFKTGDTSEI